MDRLPLPAPFAALVEMQASAEPTVEQARALGDALKALPQLGAWLREQRQLTYRTLLDGEHTRDSLAPRVGLTPQRVADIASGHLSSAALARKAARKAAAENGD